MATTEDRTALAELIFPNIEASESGGDPNYYEAKYPPRDVPEGAAVTRLGPSPTGFIHLGNLYTAFMNERLSNETGGVFILRIEDTDSRREVEGAVETLIAALDHFGVAFNEGVMLDPMVSGARGAGAIYETGDYGPYYQSDRTEIYHVYARRLLLAGLAYPCFLTEDEIGAIRTGQEGRKETPGVYGAYARDRDVSLQDARARFKRGERYVVRLNADAANAAAGTPAEIAIQDGIRGTLTMPRNEMDVVLLKSDGVPTYHFAHAVDDHLMRTTHVIRGEEWISSLPIHAALFAALGFDLPVYCHSTVLMKMDDGKKRKLSKRKDPELSLEYYRSEGYHPKAILEYLLTVINSNFEEWRAAHPDAPLEDFEMTTEKMGVSGILFDLEKLRDVSKDVLVRIPADALADFLIHWAAMYKHEAHDRLAADRARLARILDIGRAGDKPRKDLAYASQIWDFISYFYEDSGRVELEWPERAPASEASAILRGYLNAYDPADDRDAWFAKVRDLATALGYAAKPKDYKKAPETFKGHVGDVSAVIRVVLTGRLVSPDLYEIQQILGEADVRRRLEQGIDMA